MLLATGRRTVGCGSVVYSLILDGGLRASAIRRSGTLYDSSMVPPLAEVASKSLVFLIILQGTLELNSECREAPTAALVRLGDVEGGGPDRVRMRSWGEPFVGVEMAGRSAAFCDREAGWIELDGRVRQSADHLVAMLDADGRSEARLAWRSLCAALVERRILATRGDTDAGVDLLPTSFLRALSSIVERFDVLPTLDQLSMLATLSNRQLTRLTSAVGLGLAVPGGGWRAATHRLRLKTAMLFLSADGVSVAEVANAAGYGSTEAMTRAFRAAGLPPPSTMRERLCGDRRALSTKLGG
jgi:AraC-like DNA-binding protein